MQHRISAKASIIATHLSNDTQIPVGKLHKSVEPRFQKFQDFRKPHKGQDLDLISVVAVALANRPLPRDEHHAKTYVGEVVIRLMKKTGLMDSKENESLDDIITDAQAATEIANAIADNLVNESTEIA